VRCGILNIGPDPGVRRSVSEALEADWLASVQHVETGSIALEMLHTLPDSELPDIIILPFRLPILKAIDIIAGMRTRQQLRSIPILIWGAQIPTDDIDQLHSAGAARVLPGEFSTTHLDALLNFSRNRMRSEAAGGATRHRQRRYAFTSALLHASEKAVRNTRLGALFVWTGCISSVLWMCAFLHLGMSYTDSDLAPLPVYTALTLAGLSLMFVRVGDQMEAQH
jgi:CheY-like chemotaxis protein